MGFRDRPRISRTARLDGRVRHATRSSRSTSCSATRTTSPTQLAMELVRPLQEQVKERGLWACHLGPELGGPGYGQVKLALMNEILGRSRFAPTVFGCQAPDSGNAEILAHYGTDAQKERYLQPLLDGKISSCYSMTEPHGWRRSHAVHDHRRAGRRRVGHQRREVVLVERQVRQLLHRHGRHQPRRERLRGHVDVHRPGRHARRQDHPQRRHRHRARRRRAPTPTSATTTCGCPTTTCSASQGSAFAIAQTRLGGGRIHHAMRTIAQVEAAFDMMCERALSRETRNGTARIARRRAGEDRRHLDRDRAVPAARAAHGVADRQVQRLPQGPQGHLGGQGRDAEGVPRRRHCGRCTSTAHSACPTRCRSPSMLIALRGHGSRRRPDRGPQDHRRPPGPARTQGRRRALADRSPPRPQGSRTGQVRRVLRATKPPTTDVWPRPIRLMTTNETVEGVDLDRLRQWMDEQALGSGDLTERHAAHRGHAEHPASASDAPTATTCCVDRRCTSARTATRRCGERRACSLRSPAPTCPTRASSPASPTPRCSARASI